MALLWARDAPTKVCEYVVESAWRWHGCVHEGMVSAWARDTPREFYGYGRREGLVGGGRVCVCSPSCMTVVSKP